MAEQRDERTEAAALAAQHDLTERLERDGDRTASEAEQTQADRDQTGSDFDQSLADADQASADRDQHASDRDQVAADFERRRSEQTAASLRAHAASRHEREAASRDRDSTAAGRSRTTAARLATAAGRDEIALVRDQTADARDRAADARDRAAEARDRAAEARERLALQAGASEEDLEDLRALRQAAAAFRHGAAKERAAGAADREAAATDRRRAADDRRSAGLDELTAVFRRGTGELALSHELDRSRRTRRPLVVAIIDVDGLKAVNDSSGHAAGDALLRHVADAISSTKRSYDVAIRWGGDEFVFAMSDMDLVVAADRIVEIRRELEERSPRASISAGLTVSRERDTVESLVARADQDLYRAKAEAVRRRR